MEKRGLPYFYRFEKELQGPLLEQLKPLWESYENATSHQPHVHRSIARTIVQWREHVKVYKEFYRTDIEKFYVQIPHIFIGSQLKKASLAFGISFHKKKWERNFLLWSQSFEICIGKGLPLGSVVSYRIASLFLYPIEVNLPNPYFKFMDDYLFFKGHSRHKIQKWFQFFEQELQQMGLNLNLAKTYSGRINKQTQKMHTNKQEAIDKIEAGDIGAAVGFKSIKTGDTLCDEKFPIALESMIFPEPVIGIAVEPNTKADIDKLGIGLSKLSEEDPTFVVRTEEATGQTIISGMGELHLEIIVDRLKREFKVEVNQGNPQVAYKEALTKMASHREVYKKQTGGRGKFADIVFDIAPADPGLEAGLQFVNEIKGGNIPREYIPSVEKGFKEAMKTGPLAGYEMDSMKIVLKDGSFHPVDSDSLSFELAAKIGYRNVARQAHVVILEPIWQSKLLRLKKTWVIL